MTGFEPRTSGIGSDRSTNWATTTALESQLFEELLPTPEDPGSNPVIGIFIENW